MDIIVEDLNGTPHTIQNVSVSPTISIPANYLTSGAIDIFKVRHRVPDVWRYTIKVINTVPQVLKIPKTVDEPFVKSKFDDRRAIEGKWIGRKIILLLLESPHRDEYEKSHSGYNDLKPIAPAQDTKAGGAGGAIERYLHLVVGKMNLTDGFYSLIIANPIPYCCSLGVFYTNGLNKELRDDVWQFIWNIADSSGKKIIQDDFIARCTIYKPDYILNCCTSALQCHVTTLLVGNNFNNIYKAPHPAVNWNTQYKKGISVV